MNKVTGTTQAFVDMYVGDPNTGLPPIESGWVVYSVTNTGKLQHIAVLSEVDFGNPALIFSVTDSVSEVDWLSMGPGYGEPGDIQPLLVTSINTTTGEISCSADTALKIIGGLPTGITLHTVTQQGLVDKVAFCSPSDQGTVKLLMDLSDSITENDWTVANTNSIKVNSITL